MDATQGLTKRLDFGSELGGLEEVDQEALIAALRHPNVDGFGRALELLQAAARQRCAAVQDSAAEQAAAVGEADLRRLKRQFSSLKNTFLHYEVKNEFLAELLDGRPHGDEGDLLQHFELEVEASVAELRQLKRANEEAQAGIGELVGQVAAAHDAFERQRAALAGELARLQQEVTQHEQSAERVALPQLPDGLGEQECEAALATATSEARELEAAIAAGMAEAEELAAAIGEKREEAEALRAQLGALESQTMQQGEKVEANARFLSTAQWCDEAASTLTALSGLSLLHVSPDARAVHLKLVTAYPRGPVLGQDPGPCATADHELSVHLQPGGNAVGAARLTPADVEVGDIVEAARGAAACGLHRRVEYVAREVQARLSAWLHRRSLIEEVRQAGRFEVLAHSPDCATLRARLGQAAEAEVRLVCSWPAGADVVQVTAISGASDSSRAAKASALCFEGRGLLQALEAVERELTH